MKLFNVYLVGDCGPEHNELRSIHFTYKGALKAFDELRIELIESALEGLNFSLMECGDSYGVEMYCRMMKNLYELDPKKIDNYPQETPYLGKMELNW